MPLSSTSSSSSHGGSSGRSTNSLGGSLFKRTRPLVAVFHESANSYSSRKTKYRPNDVSMFNAHEGESDTRQDTNRGSSKRTPKIFTNIKKSLAGVKRWPVPPPTSATHSDFNRTLYNGKNTRVLYSTPAERLGARSSEISSHTPLSTSPPTIAQIAMGLHTSRTPHSRSIRPQPPSGFSRRHTSPPAPPTRSALKSSTTSVKEHDNTSSRLFTSHSNLSSRTTLSMPGSSQNSKRFSKVTGHNLKEGLFGKAKKVRAPFRHSSVTSNSSSSSFRKTVRFDDSASV